MFCGIPLAWIWRYCQWYWQCLHIQTKGALITCINCSHLLELTLLCLVDLWKLDESISNFKCVWCIYFYFISYRNKYLSANSENPDHTFLGVWSRPALSAYIYVLFNTTLCKSGLSNVPEILQFHDCNVTLCTEKETVRKDKIEAYVLWPERNFLFLFFILTQ